MIDLSFYNGKKVFITGHTGFKGTWLCKILTNAGANVTGYSIDIPTKPSLFEISQIGKSLNSIKGDIRNFETLERAFRDAQPEIVFHLAAQPLVLEGYRNPAYTYETNVMGTVNILECIRKSNSVKSFLNVTTDKAYKNDERSYGYKEDDILNGFDPYSNSKSCSELITSSYRNSFLKDKGVRVSTARAGNVIGGGDFAENRIIPDCVRAAIKKEVIVVRNPNSIRPYEHVLEPLFAYLMIAQKQYDDAKYEGSYNIGPEYKDCITTEKLVKFFCEKWGENLTWNTQKLNGPYESNFLKLDCSKIKRTFDWAPKWDIEKSIEKTVEFTKDYINNKNIIETMDKQLKEYMI